METITSRMNPLCIKLRKLTSSAAYRREQGAFLCDSPKLLEEILKWRSDWLETVVFTEKWLCRSFRKVSGVFRCRLL